MKYEVLTVEVLTDEKGERLAFTFGDKETCILNTHVFMFNDKAKALKSTSIWVRNLLPDKKFPNVKGLQHFKGITEEEAQEQVLDLHTKALQELVGTVVDINQETVYINGVSYFNWLPYTPRVESTSTTTPTPGADETISEEGF